MISINLSKEELVLTYVLIIFCEDRHGLEEGKSIDGLLHCASEQVTLHHFRQRLCRHVFVFLFDRYSDRFKISVCSTYFLTAELVVQFIYSGAHEILAVLSVPGLKCNLNYF